MHIAVIIVAAALAVTGYVFIFKSIYEQIEPQHEINSKLPPSNQFDPLIWTWENKKQFHHLQKQLLPDSVRYRRYIQFGYLGGFFLILAFLTVALTFGNLLN